MTYRAAGSPSAAHREFPVHTEVHGVTNGGTAECRELITSVVREWVIPVLVRKFLSTRLPGALARCDDALDSLH